MECKILPFIVYHGHADRFGCDVGCRTIFEGNEVRKMLQLKVFFEYTTIVELNECQTRAILYRLHELIRWCKMSFKPKKSRSMSIVRGKVVAIAFFVADQPIPTVLDEPV